MTPELKVKWVEALRNGKYEQTAGVLCDGRGGFCCLGVLSEVVGDEHWDGRLWENFDEEEENFTGQRFEVEELPKYALSLVGLTDSQQRLLASMNDGSEALKAHSFEEIADYIEKEL